MASLVVGWQAVRRPANELGVAQDRVMFPVVEHPRPDGTPARFVNPTTRDTGCYPEGRPATVLVDPPRSRSRRAGLLRAGLLRA